MLSNYVDCLSGLFLANERPGIFKIGDLALIYRLDIGNDHIAVCLAIQDLVFEHLDLSTSGDLLPNGHGLLNKFCSQLTEVHLVKLLQFILIHQWTNYGVALALFEVGGESLTNLVFLLYVRR